MPEQYLADHHEAVAEVLLSDNLIGKSIEW